MGDGGGVKIGDPPQKQYQTVVLQVISVGLIMEGMVITEHEMNHTWAGPAGWTAQWVQLPAAADGGGDEFPATTAAGVEPLQGAAKQQSFQPLGKGGNDADGEIGQKIGLKNYRFLLIV